MAEGREDPELSILQRMDWVRCIVLGCETIAFLALGGMVIVIVVDIVTRNLLGFSLQISDELSGYFLVAATFLAMPVSLANNAFHKVEFVENALGERARLGLQVVVTAISLIVCFAIEWTLVRFVVLSYQSGSIAMTDLATPLWLPQAVMPLGFGLLCIVLAALLIIKSSRWLTLPSDPRTQRP